MDVDPVNPPPGKSASPEIQNAEDRLSNLAVSTQDAELTTASGTVPGAPVDDQAGSTAGSRHEETSPQANGVSEQDAQLPESGPVTITEHTTATITTSVAEDAAYPSPPRTVNTADVFSNIRSVEQSTPSSDVHMSDTAQRTPNDSNAIAGPSTNPVVPATSPFSGFVTSNGPANLAKMVRTGFIFDPLMMLHCPDGYVPSDATADKGKIHPEEPMRVKRIFERMAQAGLIPRMQKLDYDEVTQDQVLLVHSQELWDKVQGQACASLASVKISCADAARLDGRDVDRKQAVLRLAVPIHLSRNT